MAVEAVDVAEDSVSMDLFFGATGLEWLWLLLVVAVVAVVPVVAVVAVVAVAALSAADEFLELEVGEKNDIKDISKHGSLCISGSATCFRRKDGERGERELIERYFQVLEEGNFELI